METPYGDQILWPDHVVENTWGAEFHPDLDIPHAQMIIRKGYLKERGMERVFVVGCAIDYCVGGLAMDAASNGFDTYIIDDATASIDRSPGGSADKAWHDVAAAGVARVASGDMVDVSI